MSVTDLPKLYTEPEAAEWLGLPVRSLKRLRARDVPRLRREETKLRAVK